MPTVETTPVLTEKEREMAELEKAAANTDSSKIDAASFTSAEASRAARVD